MGPENTQVNKNKLPKPENYKKTILCTIFLSLGKNTLEMDPKPQ